MAWFLFIIKVMGLTFYSPPPPLLPRAYLCEKVFINYCDGASYASARTDPITVGSQTIYYRGFYNLNGVYDDLFEKHSLATASTVVVSGCSAGGLA